MYSCVEGKMFSILYEAAPCFNLEFRLPVVKQLNAIKIALLPIIPSANIVSTFRISAAGISSGQPPCAQMYALACARISLKSFFGFLCTLVE